MIYNLRRSRASFRTAVTHKVYQCAKAQKLYLAALLYLCAATFTLSVSEHNPFTQPAALAAITCGEAAPPLPDRCHAHNAPMCHLTKMRFCGTFLLVHRHLHLERKRTQPFYTTRRVSGHNLRRSRAPFRTAITHKVYQCAKAQKLYLAALLYLCAATFTLSVSEHNPFTQPAALAAITCGEAAPLFGLLSRIKCISVPKRKNYILRRFFTCAPPPSP